MSSLRDVLIVGIIPYFLERENFWFEKNREKILQARKIQSFWQDNSLFLEIDQKIQLSEVLRKLDELGYEKVFDVQEPGEFCQKGGLIEIFPINSNFGIRTEFFGNKIETIEGLPIEIKDEKTSKEILKNKLKSQKTFSDLKGLKPGDYLVHLDHGIARFSGMIDLEMPTEEIGSKRKIGKYYVLQYALGDKLYVPLGLERKLSRYIGFSEPKISRLQSMLWQKTKRRIKKEAEKLAKELLEIYAKREISLRQPYQLKNLIDKELEATFKYEETPDQVKVMEDIEADFEKSKPLDRVVCGDVGFGKTEIALRAMVRAVTSSWVAAMICPTTILANQHFQNFRERLKSFPLKISLLTRLQTKPEQKKILEDLAKQKVDILIGTHRILSKDVQFPENFRLLVIDDEHRFGVKQKEKLKKMRADLDILSLSATPIPRTLYLSLCSLRDISLIQTPPPGRLPIETEICAFSPKTIKEAIEKELLRGGQIYYLHNRIETIGRAQEFLEALLPRATFGIAHGRTEEKQLIKVMSEFKAGKIDVLIATTIIEAGLDFPNVNTLIVADATRLGLAQLYQIRGRVGRSHQKATAFFFHPRRFLNKKARARLRALKEAEALGSGYRIAIADLEMRGAGNILGKEQSGNINAVGLNLYCQMVSQAILKQRYQIKD